jgi:plasmid maintenance system antidote protein VapI
MLNFARMPQAEFARRCGVTTKHLSLLAQGRARITPAMARTFQRETGIDARVWLMDQLLRDSEPQQLEPIPITDHRGTDGP